MCNRGSKSYAPLENDSTTKSYFLRLQGKSYTFTRTAAHAAALARTWSKLANVGNHLNTSDQVIPALTDMHSIPRPDTTLTSGYDGKIKLATDGLMQLHLATKDLTFAFKNGEVINPLERSHIAFRMSAASFDVPDFLFILECPH